jgi:hypothetical protein
LGGVPDSSRNSRYTGLTPRAKKAQIEKFKQAARELETDDNEKRFNEKLGQIARQKPAGETKPQDKLKPR